MENKVNDDSVGNIGSDGGTGGLSRYDNIFVLNMSSASKIERIVDLVKSLARKRFSSDSLSKEWFRHMIDPCATNEPNKTENDVVGDPQKARPPPFLPFSAVLITGTAGAGKTSSVQVLAANLNCIITGSTVISSQALSSALNRTRSAQIKTIFRTFGFNSRHVALADRVHLRRRDDVTFEGVEPICEQQWRDLSAYWPVVADIASRALDGGKGRRDTDDMCQSNIIVIDECGVILRHMLHVVVFFYYFYNALADSELYRRCAVPCIVCVGSPTQSEALESRYDHRTQNRDVQRGVDVLSALISDPVLSEYCDVSNNWIMFINNKRCLDLEFGDLLKHIEFGLPLKREHIEYFDRFVKPPGLIRDPSYAIDVTRLFISHAEVKRYFMALHDRIRVHSKHLLFDMPVYCVLNNSAYYEYCAGMGTDGAAPPKPEVWFRNNLARISNYSQFTDHNLSDTIDVEEICGSVEDDSITDNEPNETLLSCRVTFIRDSSVGMTAKTKACVVGYTGTFDDFAEILQKDLFIERTPCEQAVYAYSLISGLLFSAMYLFYSSPMATQDILREMATIPLPDVPTLNLDSTTNISMLENQHSPDNVNTDAEFYDLSYVNKLDSARVDDEITDIELMCSSDIYTDNFFLKYSIPPPVNSVSFEEIVYIYTIFRDIFLARYRIMQRHTKGAFGKTKIVTYNRRNAHRRRSCQIVSHTGSFVGMLTFVSPSNSYILEGFTNDNVFTMDADRNRIHSRILEKGLPRLLVRDVYGFILVLDYNVSKFSDVVDGKSLHICTMVDYGVTSRMAMTIAKSQGLTLESVAIDFGDNPKTLKMSQIYVGISRVVDPEKLMLSMNPVRVAYENNTYITPFTRRALQNKNTTLMF
nr:helicase-primase helicase subunit [Mastomys natalensis cytomegalovirus 3]WEG69930.1 helicase-primase helicase subunit [Mastomys natalensis cytomegalovirus 3]WEG70070.1 helicase-primase helicase subunit [Mastomys natalensis cytomegalovirus 3]WEG70210.1 helicase-primase helicase subunit [Mastomys natalensis cytomegalovirus 3]WEG70350.1 helicase-primase helicase subunit [Mastomys natalensis cytomegalovirus 3]